MGRIFPRPALTRFLLAMYAQSFPIHISREENCEQRVTKIRFLGRIMGPSEYYRFAPLAPLSLSPQRVNPSTQVIINDRRKACCELRASPYFLQTTSPPDSPGTPWELVRGGDDRPSRAQSIFCLCSNLNFGTLQDERREHSVGGVR